MKFEHKGFGVYADDSTFFGTILEDNPGTFYFCPSCDAEFSLEELQGITKKLAELNGCASANDDAVEPYQD